MMKIILFSHHGCDMRGGGEDEYSVTIKLCSLSVLSGDIGIIDNPSIAMFFNRPKHEHLT